MIIGIIGIIWIIGQDGAYLAQIFVKKVIRSAVISAAPGPSISRIEESGIQDHPNLHLMEFDPAFMDVKRKHYHS